MRKLIYPAVAIVALLGAGYAVADGINAQDAKTVSATFTATAASTSSRTCTTATGKTIVATDGKYTGTASGDPDLTGPITLHARSVIDQTDNVGTVNGTFRIDVAAGHDTVAAFAGVYDHGSLAGFAVGRAHDPAARLEGNVSADFGAASGFSNGKIGNTAGGSAVEVVVGRCRSSTPKPEHSAARGTVSAVSDTSITVAGLTCTVPAELKDEVGKFHQNDRAEIRCSLVNGTNTLTDIHGSH